MTGGQVAIPDCWPPAPPFSGFGSAQTNDTVTGALYQWLALAGRSAHPMIVGGVVSMLMPLTVVPAELPATSLAVPEALWFSAFRGSVIGDGASCDSRTAAPAARSSGLDRCRRTSPSPARCTSCWSLAARSGAPVIVGGVLSMLKPDEVNGAAVFVA